MGKALGWDGKALVHVLVLLSSSVWTNDINKPSVTCSEMGRSVCVCLGDGGRRQGGLCCLNESNAFI